jgi:hypothetical protein
VVDGRGTTRGSVVQRDVNCVHRADLDQVGGLFYEPGVRTDGGGRRHLNRLLGGLERWSGMRLTCNKVFWAFTEYCHKIEQ